MKRFFALLALVLCLSFTFVQSPALADANIYKVDNNNYSSKIGYVNFNSNVYKNSGEYLGYVSFNSNLYDESSKYLGYVSFNSNLYNESGRKVGYVSDSGNIYKIDNNNYSSKIGYVYGDLDDAARGAAFLLLFQ